MLLSEEQILKLIEWAFVTPGAREVGKVKAQLAAMGVEVANDAAYKFINDRLEPGLDHIATIQTAAKFSSQVAEAMEGQAINGITQGTALVIQQAAFDWALEHKQNGTFKLDDPAFMAAFVDVAKVVNSGLISVDRKEVNTAKLKETELRCGLLQQALNEANAKLEAAKAIAGDKTISEDDKRAKWAQFFGMAGWLILACLLTLTPPMASAKSVDELRQKVEAAMNAQDATLGMSDEQLEAAAMAQKLGTNCNGWVNPYPSSHPFSMFKEHQLRAALNPARFAVDVWGRQTGKDFSGQGGVVYDCLMNPGMTWMTAAPSERQSLDSLDHAKNWAKGFGLAIEDYTETREGLGGQTLLKSAEIVWSNGSKEVAVPGKPDTVRGKSASIFLTEFDFFENPQATWRAILPSITNPLRGGEKKVRIKSTPNGVGSAMHKIVTRADKKLKWSRSLVTVYHAVLYGLPIDIEALREAFEDDPEGFNQECLCRFLDASSVLLSYPLIATAESFLASMAATPEALQAEQLPLVMGIDFGRTSDPTVAITAQQSLGRSRVRDVKKFVNVNTVEQVKFILPTAKLCHRICVDYTGPGIGFGDMLVNELGRYNPKQHEFGKVELCTFTPELKRSIFPALKVAFDKLAIEIPIDIWLREDLHAMNQVFSGGAYSYSAPRTALGHSDGCTALALMIRAAGTAAGPCGAAAVPNGGQPGSRTNRLAGAAAAMRRFMARNRPI